MQSCQEIKNRRMPERAKASSSAKKTIVWFLNYKEWLDFSSKKVSRKVLKTFLLLKLKRDRQVFTLGDLWGRDTTILLAWGGHAMGG